MHAYSDIKFTEVIILSLLYIIIALDLTQLSRALIHLRLIYVVTHILTIYTLHLHGYGYICWVPSCKITFLTIVYAIIRCQCQSFFKDKSISCESVQSARLQSDI